MRVKERGRRKTLITIVSSPQAKVGSVFLFKGPGLECNDCEYYRVCIRNVEPQRVYRVIHVRNRKLKCAKYGTEMRVVEVVDEEVQAAIPSKQAISGAIITFKPPDCKKEDCDNYELCYPIGLRDGDRCEVVEVTESLQCSSQFPLKRAFLRLARLS